jgi:hypothetical protein
VEFDRGKGLFDNGKQRMAFGLRAGTVELKFISLMP